jgi:sarcosine oxidase, subunit beta
LTLETADVGIIGAGIHGVCAGYHLARMGVKTIIFDRWAPAGGPTGRSSAICRAFYTNRFIAQVAHDSLEMFTAFAEISGGRDAGFRRTGDLYLLGPEELEHVHQTAAMLAEVGTQIELLTPSALTQRHPEMNLDGVAIAAWEVHAGYADPVATTQGLFQRAVELGLTPRLYTQVSGIEPRPGGGAYVVTSGTERIECARLLIAAGPWTKHLVEQVHVELPLTVERHYVATFGWSRAPALPYVLGDIPAGYYMKPEGLELFLVGPLPSEPQADPDSYSASVTAEEISRMASGITARIPSLALADTRGGWASLYDVSPDWQPVIGEVAPGIFVDAGTSGHGFKLAPALGKHVARLVLGKDVDDGLRQFHPSRFEADRLLAAGFGSARIIG